MLSLSLSSLVSVFSGAVRKMTYVKKKKKMLQSRPGPAASRVSEVVRRRCAPNTCPNARLQREPGALRGRAARQTLSVTPACCAADRWLSEFGHTRRHCGINKCSAGFSFLFSFLSGHLGSAFPFICALICQEELLEITAHCHDNYICTAEHS